MLEQLIFTTLAVALFGVGFFKMMRENDTSYLALIVIEALGIAIDFVFYISGLKMNIFIKGLIYAMSIVLPIVIYILQKRNIDLIKSIKQFKIKILLMVGNDKKAKEILNSIIKKNPNNYDAHKLLAKIYEKEGGVRKAIEEYVTCIEINKKDYDSYYKVSNYMIDLGKKDEAIQMLSSLLAKKPDYYNATIDLGNLLIEKGAYKEAVNVFSDALKYSPINYELNYYLGMSYTMLNDFQNAKICYEKAAEVNSLMYKSKYNLAQIAMLYKETELAEKYFTETMQDEDLEADSYFELAKIKLIQGNKELAIRYANIAVDIDSEKIAKKIKSEPLFIPILIKISIPFNLEKREDKEKLSENEENAKVHLEETSNITRNMGYNKEEWQMKRERMEKEEMDFKPNEGLSERSF